MQLSIHNSELLCIACNTAICRPSTYKHFSALCKSALARSPRISIPPLHEWPFSLHQVRRGRANRSADPMTDAEASVAAKQDLSDSLINGRTGPSVFAQC